MWNKNYMNRSTIRRYRSTNWRYRSTNRRYWSTNRRYRSTIRRYRSTIRRYRSTNRRYRSTNRRYRSTIRWSIRFGWYRTRWVRWAGPSSRSSAGTRSVYRFWSKTKSSSVCSNEQGIVTGYLIDFFLANSTVDYVFFTCSCSTLVLRFNLFPLNWRGAENK